ncbi:MAG: hypothetical protein ACK4Z0_04735 [Sphingomonadaceae bacterium]
MAPGNAFRLLQLHVVRPGRIVTPDLMLTRAEAVALDGGRAPVAVQRLLVHPAIQLEPGDWALAPGWAAVRAMETYLVPALGLWRDGSLAWLFLARQALAEVDDAGEPVLLLDGEAAAELAPAPAAERAAAPGGVSCAIRLGAARPFSGRAGVTLSARRGDIRLADTRVDLERIG